VSDRNLPASPRRLALARKAGVVPHAPTLTTAAAWAGALAAMLATAPQLIAGLREALRRGLAASAPFPAAVDATRAGPGGSAVWQGSAASPSSVATLAASVWDGLGAALAAALPILAAAAALALVVHLAQTRGAWLPRRNVPGAPAPAVGAAARLRGGAWAAARTGSFLAVTAGWLGAATPAFAAHLMLEPERLLPSGAALIAALLLALAATWIVLGGLELIGRSLALARAARMTPEEQREELRATGGGARMWRQRRQPAGQRQRDELAEATLLVVGESVCAAIAWHPQRSPVPQIVASRRGRGVQAFLAVARGEGLPIRHAPALAGRLAASGRGAVPEALWPELAKLVR
jgi:flagellar biosynthesis protein FlhB